MIRILRIFGKEGRSTVPFIIRMKLGLKQGDVISYTLHDDGTLVVKKEKICDNNCPNNLEINNDISDEELIRMLNGLSPKSQRAALVHLSVKWANKRGGETHAQ